MNAFAVKSMLLLSELANVTGRGEWSAKLAKQAAKTKAGMLRTMYSATDGMWCDGVCTDSYHGKAMRPGTFHSQHYALSLGITPDSGVTAALKYLRQMGMVGSTYSAHSLVHGLFDRAHTLDHGQAALDLMTQCTDHSWCHMLQLGATTTWEHWFPHDGTHSHPWASTPVSAIAEGLMGIKPTVAGWAKWIAKPAPGNLTTAAITVPTPLGPIKTNFTKFEMVNGGQSQVTMTLRVTIPVGTAATVCMPLYGATAAKATMKLDSVLKQGRADDSGVLKGNYICLDDLHGDESSSNVGVSVECTT